MSDTFRSAPSEKDQWSGGNGYKGSYAENATTSYENDSPAGGNEVGKTLLIGVLGGLATAAGYLVYQRLPDEQKERLQAQMKSQLQSRINEIRQNFNI
ncbi:MAG: hypothetical protein M3Y18_06535 [Candidatus Eremiobacteraeota bacterium]|nr:hypothetical protein [Candidatus Eremiobacteraeota bacterium]